MIQVKPEPILNDDIFNPKIKFIATENTKKIGELIAVFDLEKSKIVVISIEYKNDELLLELLIRASFSYADNRKIKTGQFASNLENYEIILKSLEKIGVYEVTNLSDFFKQKCSYLK